jgi:hypothetical protein
MSLNDSQGLERTLEYCDKSNESFLNTTNVSISTVTTGCPSNNMNKSIIINNQTTDESRRKSHIHFNRLWSVWYGILVTIFQGYLIIAGFQKYIGKHSFILITSSLTYYNYIHNNFYFVTFRLLIIDMEKWLPCHRT